MFRANEQSPSLEQFLTSLSPDQLDVLCSVYPYNIESLAKRAYESRKFDPSLWRKLCPDDSFGDAPAQDIWESHKAELLARYLENVFFGSPEAKTPQYMNEVIKREGAKRQAVVAEVPVAASSGSPRVERKEAFAPAVEKTAVQVADLETGDEITAAWEKLEGQTTFQVFCALAEISSKVDTSKIIPGLSFGDFGVSVNAVKSLRRESDPGSLNSARESFVALRKLYDENVGKFNFNNIISVIDECYWKNLGTQASEILRLCGVERLDSTGKIIDISDPGFEIAGTSGIVDRKGKIIRVMRVGYRKDGKYLRRERVEVGEVPKTF